MLFVYSFIYLMEQTSLLESIPSWSHLQVKIRMMNKYEKYVKIFLVN